MLAVALSGYKEVIDHAYDLAAIGRYVEFMSVMSYDYHGAWERVLGHVSPLYYRSGDQFPQYNTVGLQSLPSVQHCMILVISLSTTQYVCSHFPQYNTICLCTISGSHSTMAHNVHLQINIVRKYSFKSNAMIYIQYTVLQC